MAARGRSHRFLTGWGDKKGGEKIVTAPFVDRARKNISKKVRKEGSYLFRNGHFVVYS